jgi:amino acid adenylation domain-containing protein
MNLVEFLTHLRSLDIHLYAQDGRLKYNAPGGVLTPELRQELVNRKAEILAYLESIQEALPAIHRLPREDPFLASYAQQRLWFIQRFDPSSTVYHVTSRFRLQGVLNISVLEHSLGEIIRRHEALRTTLVERDGELIQIIHPHLPGAEAVQSESLLAQLGISQTPLAEREQQAIQWLQEINDRPFDLAQGPLIRFALARLSDQEAIFQVVMHHVVTDGWSMGVFSRELSSLYNAYCREESDGLSALSPLPELPVQYVDYAAWQHGWLQGERLQAQVEYWKTQLGGQLTPLALPTDYPRPAIQTYRGAHQDFELDETLSKKLNQLCSTENVTPFMLLLAALKVLLYRYSGQEDILVGTPIANRRLVELEGLIGFFVNTLVLRSDLSGVPTFRQFLQKVRQTALEAFDHQDLPFEQLVHILSPVRDLSRSPLFQVMFAMQNVEGQQPNLEGLQVSRLTRQLDRAHFEWTVFVWSSEKRLRGRLLYYTDLFAPETIGCIVRNFENLLQAIVDNPDQYIDRLTLLAAEEQKQILVEWNATQTDYPRQAFVDELFEAQAARTPDALAVVFGAAQATYAQLNQRADQAALVLRRLGVGQGDLVGVCMERSLEMVVAMLAILKAGAAYVPLDPTYPAERLGFMLRDTKVPALISQKRWLSVLPASDLKNLTLKTILLEGDQIIIAGETEGSSKPDTEKLTSKPQRDENTPAPADRLAYIMYTSGSTGTPKGICIPHRAITRLVLNTDYVSLGPGDRVAQASNAAFDAATFEIWGTLLNGACLVGISQETLLSPITLVEALQRDKIDVLFLTTALFNQVAAAAPGGFSSLRQVMFGGEAVTPHWVGQVLQAGPPQRLLHVYGPTENTTFSTWHWIHEVPEGATTIPIGKPVANSTLYILDSYLNPTPPGVVGEVYLGGDGLATGYFERQELTQKSFICSPFDPSGQERLYKTGDLGRFLNDGSVEFVGRVDTQIKLRGFRVELGEIEAALLSHPSVAQVAVLVMDEQAGDGALGEKRLAAYITPRSAGRQGTKTLREYLKNRLPAYMIPSAFVFLDELPVNANGKLDRQRLPAPQLESAERLAQQDEPRDALERQLVYIWETTLGVKPIGIHDNFFDLGGHSLMAARLFGRIEQYLGARLPLASLFQSPTIADLAEHLRQAPDPQGWATLVPIQPHGSHPPFFCVHNFGGEVINFAELSARLGKDRPFYGLQARGIDGVNPPHASIPEMAAYYIEVIREVQPHGPYQLGGYCFGGVVAYEMAYQLHQQGETVGLVALMDSSPPRRFLREQGRPPRPRLWDFLRNLPLWLIEFLRSGEIAIVLRRKLRLTGKQLAGKLGRPVEITPWDIIGDQVRTESLPHKQLMDLHLRALWEYRTPLYPGWVTLFRIRRMPLFRAMVYDFGWGQFAQGGVDVQIVPGAHYNILEEPHVLGLAQKLSESLQKAR